MRLSSTTSLLAGAAAAADYSPFRLPYVHTSQPSGNPDGQENFYHIEFNISSTNGDLARNGYCWASWADNSWTSSSVFSDAVPVGSWIECAHNASDISDQTSGFAFQLYKPFGIGDFAVAVQQNFTETSYVSAELHSCRQS
jgi:hypothetical protein